MKYIIIYLLLAIGFQKLAAAAKIPDFDNRLYQPVRSEICDATVMVKNGVFEGRNREGGNCYFRVLKSIAVKKSGSSHRRYYVVEGYSTAGGSYYELHGYIFTSQGELIHYFPPAIITNENLSITQQLEGIEVKDNYIYTFTSNPRYGNSLECSDKLPVKQQFFQFDQVIARKYSIKNNKLQYLGAKILPTTYTVCANGRYFQGF